MVLYIYIKNKSMLLGKGRISILELEHQSNDTGTSILLNLEVASAQRIPSHYAELL